MSLEFYFAYKSVSVLSSEEARERIELLKRYLLPLEKEVPPPFFNELFKTFVNHDSDVSLRPYLLNVYLYNLLLRRSKNEDLIKDEDSEYEYVKQFDFLRENFPYIEPDVLKSLRPDVLRDFYRMNKRTIFLLIPESVIEKSKKCESIYLTKRRNSYAVACKTRTGIIYLVERRERSEALKIFNALFVLFQN